ncbi:hypothetical protein BDV06DRAFT_226250 [Aspergillus oleicola]
MGIEGVETGEIGRRIEGAGKEMRHYGNPAANLRLFNAWKYLLQAKCWAALAVLYRTPYQNLSRTGKSHGQAHIRPECFDAARRALQLWLRSLNAYQRTRLPVEWNLLSCILEPCIAITFHIIASSNTEDIVLLENVVSNLQGIQAGSTSSALVNSSISPPPYPNSQPVCFNAEGHVVKENKLLSATGAGEDSLFEQVMDEDIRRVIGKAEADELMRVFEMWMGGLVDELEALGEGITSDKN